MQDDEFQARIERGERFAKGDILAVDLRIHQKLDKTLGAYARREAIDLEGSIRCDL